MEKIDLYYYVGMAAQPQDTFVAQMNALVQQLHPKDFETFHGKNEEGNFNFLRQLEQLRVEAPDEKESKRKKDNTVQFSEEYESKRPPTK